jgi:hypothetical protein
MNPPFANADDIKHIMHALKMLKPGGRLVAICANGPRQNDKLRPIVESRGCHAGIRFAPRSTSKPEMLIKR